MATNHYFNNFNSKPQQSLVDQLVIEAIRMFGNDVWYISRNLSNENDILNEASNSYFDRAQLIEMYIKNIDSFGGEGDFLSKFNLQIRDSITFTVSQTRFKEDIGDNMNLGRPLEGDLIYFPMNKKIFQIMHVEHEAIFYQMGSLQTYDLKCELFEYSNETFSTGIDEIDSLYQDYNTTSQDAIDNIDDFDPLADNDAIQEAAEDILDFTEDNPFSEGGRW